MFRGVHNIGVGVKDMDKAIAFYTEKLGFSDIMFDYTGELPGMELIERRAALEEAEKAAAAATAPEAAEAVAEAASAEATEAAEQAENDA